jgi:hypothetical protein
MLDVIQALNRRQFALHGDPEIETRIAQYEMAYRMQTSVPDLISLSDESAGHVLDAYGPDVKRAGQLSRRTACSRAAWRSADVRFIQLYHRGWDQHYNLPSDLRLQCGDIDQPCAALISDLKQRGLLDDTLIVWGGEFGRTTYSQGKLDGDQLRPRSSWPLFHDVAWPVAA